MTLSLKHKFTSAIPDAGDPTIVQPSNWNDEHALIQATDTILGRVTAGDGVTEELTAAQVRTLLNVADGATANQTDAYLLDRTNHTGTESADVLTDGTTNKVYTATEQTKLAGIAAGATANSTDAFLLDRANHTGTQTAATISDFSTAADLRIAAAVGVSVQAYDADLTAWADVNPSAYLNAAGIAAAYQPLDSDLTAIAAIGTQSYGRSLLALVDAAAARTAVGLSSLWSSVVQLLTFAEAWVALNLNGSLSTRALIKALVPQVGMSVLLTESGRVGNFVWTLGDFSARITADTQEGIYLKASSVAATVGAWVRQYDDGIWAGWFGAVGDGTTNDTAAIAGAEVVRRLSGDTLYFGRKTFLYDGQAVDRATGGGWIGVGECKFIPSANSQVLIDITGAVISAASPIPFAVRGFHFAPNSKTGITCIRENAPYFTTLSDLTFTGDLSYAAIFTGGTGSQTGWVNISNIHQRGAATWVFQSADDTHYLFNVNINNFNQQGTGGSTWPDKKIFKLSRACSVLFDNVNVASLDGDADGISMVGDCQGVFLNNVIIGWPKIGVIAQVGTDTLKPSYVYMSNVGIDQPVTNGMYIHGRSWFMRNINATNGRDRSSTGSGILVKSDSTDIDFSGVLCAYMNHAGFEVETGAAKVRVSGLTAENNNQNAGANKEINLNACSFADVKLFGKNVVGAAGVTATGQRLINGITSQVVSLNNTPASTTAVTTAEDLMSYTIPAAALQVGQRVRVKAWGTTGANANTKTGRLWFGANNMGGWSGALNAVGWSIDAEVDVTGSATQSYVRQSLTSSIQVASGTGTGAISGTIVVKFQGQNGTASAGDITCNGLEVEIMD